MSRYTRMATILAALVLAISIATCTLAQSKISETYFTFTAPPEWQVKTVPGLKYKVAVGRPANGFAPNINVVDEAFPQSVEKYADANERTLQRAMSGYKKLSRTPFTTSSNAKGVRLAAEQVQQGRKLRSIFYFFATKNGPKLVVTCTSLASDGTKYDSFFDTAMKSMNIK